jgi:hypothetical protein
MRLKRRRATIKSLPSRDSEVTLGLTADPAWNHESVLAIYRRIEDWHGEPDPARRAGHILCRSILGGLHHQYARI